MDYFRHKGGIYVGSHTAYRNVHYLSLAEFFNKVVCCILMQKNRETSWILELKHPQPLRLILH